jgi:CheY-like chemotaxis protein
MSQFTIVGIVEDNPIDIFINTKVIEQTNLCDELVTYNSAREALASLANNQASQIPNPELILLDIRMPDMDGFDFLDAFMKLPEAVQQKCKIIMLSSSIDDADESKARSYPAVYDFVCKPLTREKIERFNLE